MKPIPQEEIDKAAEKYSKKVNIHNYGGLYPGLDESFGEVTITDFKEGVKFAEEYLYSQIEDIIIENQRLKNRLDIVFEIVDKMDKVWMK